MPKPLIVIWSLLGCAIVAGCTLAALGHGDLGVFVSAEVTAVTMLGGFLYAGWHSRTAWPNDSFGVRLGKILFFERPPRQTPTSSEEQ